MFGGIGKDLDEHVYELKLPGFIWSKFDSDKLGR